MPREVYTFPQVFPQTSVSKLRKHVPEVAVIMIVDFCGNFIDADLKEQYAYVQVQSLITKYNIIYFAIPCLTKNIVDV